MSVVASIIIPVKNGAEKIGAVLESVIHNARKITFEIIAVDSGSTDGTKDVIGRYPVKLIEIDPQSFSHGGSRNLGAKSACGEFLVFLSQDAIPSNDDWLSCLISPFDDPAIAAVYGRQIPNPDASPFEKFFLYYLYPDRKKIKDSIDAKNLLLEDIFFSDVASAIRRDVWQSFKFNEDIIMSEDQELAKRLLLARRKILYEPSSVVIHSHSYSLFELFSRNFDSGMSLYGVVKAPFARTIKYEIDFLRAGAGFLSKNGYWLHLAAFPVYETFRLAGFTLGYCSAILPRGIKTLLSQNKAYWKQH